LFQENFIIFTILFIATIYCAIESSKTIYKLLLLIHYTRHRYTTRTIGSLAVIME